MKVFLLVLCAQVFVTFGRQSSSEYPAALTVVSYPNKKKVDGSNYNAIYNKAEWRDEPKVTYPNAVPGKSYTLLCVDPDAPAYEDGQYWLHWLVSNIKGEDFIKGDLSKANHLTGYNGPSPPKGSGLHRYKFLAFEEDNNRDVEVPAGRSRFQLNSWLERNPQLTGPVGGAQFRSHY